MAAHGLTYTMLSKIMRSDSYKREAKQYDMNVRSPVHLSDGAVFMDERPTVKAGYNLPGVLLLIHHAFINRSKTRARLVTMHGEAGLSSGLSYNTVRGTAILAEELHPLPDPIALLAYLSCANLIFRRWTMHLYDPRQRTEDELGATCYTINENRGEKNISIQYDLCYLTGRRMLSLSDASLIRELQQSCYGNLLPVIQCHSTQSTKQKKL
jgi:hypothetical protein